MNEEKGKIKFTYETEVALVKKNRTTKEKLEEEYPTLGKVVKTSTMIGEYGEDVYKAINEHNKPLIVESVEPKPEKKPIYKKNSVLVKEHLEKGTQYYDLFVTEVISSDIKVLDKSGNEMEVAEGFANDYFKTKKTTSDVVGIKESDSSEKIFTRSFITTNVRDVGVL